MLFTVASYNIHKAVGTDRRRLPGRILDVLAEIDADIVALQEADMRFGARTAALPPALIAAHSPYEPVAFDIRPGGLGWHGNALLVRRGTAVTAALPLTLPMLEPRGAVLAELELGGQPLRVVGMHLDLSGLRRRAQAHGVVTQVAARAAMPTVLMGDFNEWRARGGCLTAFGGDYALAPTGASFHARRPVAALDRIVLGAGVELFDCGVHRSPAARLASDHLPIWARMAFA